jgi:hypothetical protein
MNLTRILAIVLFVVSLGLAYVLYDNINSTIEFKDYINKTEAQITEKLSIIREAEKAYLEQHGKYTASFDTLIDFIERGQVPITVRTETITQLSYGEEKVTVKIDTVGYMSAKDRIFKKNFSMNATAEGSFEGFLVKEGDYVVKGTPAYRLRVNGKTDIYKFTDSGHISGLAQLNNGDEITRGQFIANLWEYHLNPNIDIKTLGIVPGSGKTFDIFVGKIDRGGLSVSVIEVKDPAPINPDRKASNEAKIRQPLGFGSRVNVETTGNWE